MKYLLIGPFVLQSVLMLIDEFYFHRRRGLGKWERRGHPIDTASVVLIFSFIFLVAPSASTIAIAVVLSGVSSIIITKDEFVHHRECTAGEQWLHAALFVLHPLVLATSLLIWPSLHSQTPPETWEWLASLRGLGDFFLIFYGLSVVMLLHQIFFWNVFSGRLFPWKPDEGT